MIDKLKMLGIGIIITILCILAVNTSPALQAAEGETRSVFSDLNPADPDIAYVKYLSGKNIITGYPDGSFKPQDGLTRAQAAVVMVKAGQIKIDPNAVSPFKDVKPDHWARPYIAAAVQAGYISGFPDGTYNPDQQLTRAQAISLILRLSQQAQTATLPNLKDINTQHWAAQAVATGLAAGMVGLSADGQNYLPDAAFTRINMVHALGILITEDPNLYASSLPGKIKPLQGKTTIIKADSQKEEELKETMIVSVGDSIITAKGASAELSYPDGTSMLIKEDSRISIKAAQGRKYVKTNGQEGIAIDWLNLDMKQGTMFTGLATKHETTSADSSTISEKKTSHLKKNIASLNGVEYIAATDAAPNNNQEMPWYETSKTKKVKVKVDMPWGVAAVRGTFIVISVSPSGQASVSCLNGNAEVTNAGQTVPLGQNQSTQVTNQTAAPQQTAPIPAEAKQLFEQVTSWIEETAKTMDQNQEQVAPPPPPALISALKEVLTPVQEQTPAQDKQEQTQTTPTTNKAMTALQAINDALGSIGISTGNNSVAFQTSENKSNSSSSSSTHSTSPPAVQISTLNNLTVNSSGHGSIDFTVNPADSEVAYSYNPASGFGTPAFGTGTNPQDRWWMVDNAIQTFTVIVTASKTGYTTSSQSFTVTVLPGKSCEVTGVTAPTGANIAETSITANVGNEVSSVTVAVSVSGNASWKLFNDSDCTQEITNKTMALTVGTNTGYIKVTAQDGSTTKNYTLVINREGADISGTFTDPNFKQAVWEWLGNTIGSNPVLFTKQNLTDRMKAQNNTLDVNNKNIKSVTGLENFEGTGLTTLKCNNNHLTSLPNLPTSLIGLECYYNYLDVFTGTTKTIIDACTASTKSIIPQYRYTYTGSAITLSAGGNKQLTGSELQRQQSPDGINWASPVDGVISDFTFETSDANVATVDTSGNITAVGEGSCYINVLYKGINAEYTKVIIYVTVNPLDAATAPTAVILAVGSSNPVGGVTNVAIPAAGGTDTTGMVTGWASGTANTINFTVIDGGSAQSTITINGDTYTSGTDYTITSAGTLTILVTTTESDKAACVRTFQVTAVPIQVSTITVSGADNATTIITDDGTLQMCANVLPANAANKEVTWSVENGTGAASISETGLLTALASGKVTVKATSVSASMVSGTLEITISNQVVAINTLEDLAAVRPNSITVYNLMRDLDFNDPASYAYNTVNTAWTTGTGWTPIGNSFTGTFDGNGHTISHLYNNSSNGGLGLFSVTGGTVKNLGLLKVSINTTGARVGAVSSYLNGSILNCYSTGNISAGSHAGGIVGFGQSGNIKGCSSSANVAVTGYAAGGICGHCESNPVIEDCFATGNISGGVCQIGGIVGWAKYATISRSYATGKISGNDHDVGGLVGLLQGGSLQKSYALNSSVSITAGTATSVGKVAGGGSASGCFANSAMLITPTTHSGADGTGITVADAKLKSKYIDNGWDIDNAGSSTTTTWVINDGNSLPALRAQNPMFDATEPSILLTQGSTNPVGGVTNVGIPAAGGTNNTGAVTGWASGTANTIKFTVADGGIAQSTITINGAAYTSGTDYTITSAGNLTIVVTTTETGRTTCVRTFQVTVAS